MSAVEMVMAIILACAVLGLFTAFGIVIFYTILSKFSNPTGAKTPKPLLPPFSDFYIQPDENKPQSYWLEKVLRMHFEKVNAGLDNLMISDVARDMSHDAFTVLQTLQTSLNAAISGKNAITETVANKVFADLQKAQNVRSVQNLRYIDFFVEDLREAEMLSKVLVVIQKIEIKQTQSIDLLRRGFSTAARYVGDIDGGSATEWQKETADHLRWSLRKLNDTLSLSDISQSDIQQAIGNIRSARDKLQELRQGVRSGVKRDAVETLLDIYAKGHELLHALIEMAKHGDPLREQAIQLTSKYMAECKEKDEKDEKEAEAQARAEYTKACTEITRAHHEKLTLERKRRNRKIVLITISVHIAGGALAGMVATSEINAPKQNTSVANQQPLQDDSKTEPTDGSDTATKAQIQPAEPPPNVFVVDGGMFYHMEGCKNLRKSMARSVTLHEATGTGYQKCSVCSAQDANP